jgi:hypothetical protein
MSAHYISYPSYHFKVHFEVSLLKIHKLKIFYCSNKMDFKTASVGKAKLVVALHFYFNVSSRL